MIDEKKQSVVQLNDHMAQNWKFDGGPVAMLNPDSSMHERIAYCWGLAANIEAIAAMGNASADGDVSRFANLLSSTVVPLLATLGNLGDLTAEADGGVSSIEQP
jgi:hypothetical protein